MLHRPATMHTAGADRFASAIGAVAGTSLAGAILAGISASTFPAAIGNSLFIQEHLLTASALSVQHSGGEIFDHMRTANSVSCIVWPLALINLLTAYSAERPPTVTAAAISRAQAAAAQAAIEEARYGKDWFEALADACSVEGCAVDFQDGMQCLEMERAGVVEWVCVV